MQTWCAHYSTASLTVKRSSFLLALLPFGFALHSVAADAPKPLRVLLIAGGCCHDYATQKDILKKGVEARTNALVEVIYTADYPMGANGKPDATKPKFAIYGNPEYAKGFDVVLHDECSAGISDPEIIKGVIKPHLDGIPGVNLHCAMHSYRFGDFKTPVAAGADNAGWFEYLGLQSASHGPQEPIAISFTDRNSPITKGLADWTTIKEELYNNIQILTGRALATGKQRVKDNDVESVIVWTNEFGPKKTRVFSTTIGHNNATVEDARYLDLVTRGILWAAGKLNDDGTPATGYAPHGK